MRSWRASIETSVQGALYRAADRGEGDFLAEKSRHGNFVSGVENRRRSAARFQNFVGHTDSWESCRIRLVKREAADLGEP